MSSASGSCYDVIVVGARCAGAPLAMVLADAGHSVLLLDRARFPSDTMSTHWMLHRGVVLLRSWGLLEKLVATGCPAIHRLRVDFGDFVLDGVPSAPDSPAVTYAPRRIVLDKLLVDAARAAGAEVAEGVSVQDVLWSDGTVAGVVAQDADGRPLTPRARLVVGADGRNSTIARAVRAQARADRGPLAATAYGYWSGVPVDGARIYIRPGVGISVWPTHDEQTVVSVTFPRTVFLDRSRDTTGKYLEYLERTAGVAGLCAGGRLAGPVRGAGNLRNFSRRSYGAGWALTGDAGHHMDPIGAHGISDAFEDAANLATAIHNGLTGALAMDRALARYQARRDATRATVFEFTCRQAALEPLDADLTGLLSAVHGDPGLTGDLLGVFAGGRRIEEFAGRGVQPRTARA